MPEQSEYPIEYPKVVKAIEIMREGTWNWFEFTREIMEEIVHSYDPAMLRANINFDHQMQGPASGHILKVYLEDETSDLGALKIMADVGFLESGVEAIESGEYNERSLAISRSHPYDGIWYLWHVSLLGANTPAVAGMGPIVIPADSESEKESAFSEYIKKRDAEPALMSFAIGIKDGLAQMPKSETAENEEDLDSTVGNEATNFKWTKEETHIEFQMRMKSRFKETSMRDEMIDENKKIAATVGQMKAKYIPEGKEKTGQYVHIIRFERGQWTFKTAKQWVEKNTELLSQEITARNDVILTASAETKSSGETPERSNPMTETEENVTEESVEISEKPVEKEPEEVKSSETAKPSETIVAQAQTLMDVQAKVVELEAANAKLERDALARENLYAGELKSKNAEYRLSIIRSTIRTLLTTEYIFPNQVSLGLEQVVNALQDVQIETEFGEMSAQDALFKILKEGGKVKIKHDFSPVQKDDEDEDVDKYEGAEKLGADTSVQREIDRLMKEDPEMPYTTAYQQAVKSKGNVDRPKGGK